MNSAHVTEKLPLWAGGDLSRQEMQLVQEHLNTCQACRLEAMHYAEALTWVKESMEAPFTQEDLLSVRNSVMTQIRKPQKSKPKRLLPYIPWLLAAASIPAALMLYSAKDGTAMKVNTASVAANATPIVASTAAMDVNSTRPDAQSRPLAERPKTVTKQSVHGLLAQSQPANFMQASAITHIEFQTEDPNIKIIWFPNPRPSTIAPLGATNEQPS
jgi:anti-sigma factor RsiW